MIDVQQTELDVNAFPLKRGSPRPDAGLARPDAGAERAHANARDDHDSLRTAKTLANSDCWTQSQQRSEVAMRAASVGALLATAS